MKKIFRILGISLLLIPSIAKADVGAPELKPYQIIVTNPAGADVYNNDREVSAKAPYNTKCDVYYETILEDGLYLDVTCEGHKYEDGWTYIKSNDDIKLLSTDHEYMNYYDGMYSFYALGDIELYTDEYLMSGHNGQVIKAGTDFTAHETTSSLWYYYESGNIKGYFRIYENGDNENLNVVRKHERNVMITDGTTIYQNQFGEEKIDITIPNFTEVFSEYYAPYYAGYFYNRYKINYNGVEGWVDEFDSCPATSSKLLYEGRPGIEIYDKTLENKVTNINLKENKLYDVLYVYSLDDTDGFEYDYTNIDGTYYWVKSASYGEEGFEYFANIAYQKYELTFKNDVQITDGVTVPATSILASYFYDSDKKAYFITYKDVNKWIELSEQDVTVNAKSLDEEVKETQTSSSTQKQTKTNSKDFYNLKTNTIIAIVAAVIISLCAIITLVFLKRKKNNKVSSNVTLQNNTVQAEFNNLNQQQAPMNQEVSNTGDNNQNMNMTNETINGAVNNMENNQNMSNETINTNENNQNNGQNNI